VLIFVTEIIIAIKFSDGEFPNPMPPNIKRWLQLAFSTWAIGCLTMVAYIFNSNRGKEKSL